MEIRGARDGRTVSQIPGHCEQQTERFCAAINKEGGAEPASTGSQGGGGAVAIERTTIARMSGGGWMVPIRLVWLPTTLVEPPGRLVPREGAKETL